MLRPGQEVTRPQGLTIGAAGHFTAKVTGKTLRWTLTFSHLTGRPTVTTLSKGARGTTGLAFKSLCYRCLSPAHGTVDPDRIPARRNAARPGIREHPYDAEHKQARSAVRSPA